jgi:hypothetical protein
VNATKPEKLLFDRVKISFPQFPEASESRTSLIAIKNAMPIDK